MSDHGISLYSTIRQPEFFSKKHAIWYLSWNTNALDTYKEKRRPRVLFITNPWLQYIKKNKRNAIEANGTIFYPYHSVPGVKLMGHLDEESIRYLKSLDEEYQPISVSMHMHDLYGERAKLFESSGYEVVSSGDINDKYFQDNFINLASKFQYAISESFGSQVVYLTILGIPCQILQREIEEPDLMFGGLMTDDETYKRNLQTAYQIFRDLPEKITKEQKDFVEGLLGVNAKFSRAKISLTVWSSLFLVGIPWFFHSGIKVMLKVIRNRFQHLA
jgi:hypothetical protein